MNKLISSFSLGALALCVSGLVSSLQAQQTTTLPANWQQIGSLSPSADPSTLKTTPVGQTSPDKAILVGTAGQPYRMAETASDFMLTMAILTTTKADVDVLLPSGSSIRLTGRTVNKAPGLWQTVDIKYRSEKPAMIEKLTLNGVTIEEGRLVANAAPSPDATPGTLGLRVTNGSVAVKNLVYKAYANRAVARWQGPLTYQIYPGENVGRREDLAGKTLLKQDTTAMISYDVTYGQPRQHAILFSGKLNALQGGEYQFQLNHGGVAGLWIDGKETIPTVYRDLGQPTTGQVTLTAGPHDVQVFFVRSWPRPGLGLFVSQANTRPQALHILTSLPEPDPVSLFSVQAEARPERIRSFVQVPGEKKKRTHSLSVGSPAGIHYTLDLNQMALLQTWKGDFANVTEMWYERGEPQLLTPMGATVPLPPQTALMVLSEAGTEAWPDSVDENTLQYKGLTLDKQGYPTIDYVLAGASVTDASRPGENSLDRTLTITGSPKGTLYCRVAAGSSVEEMGKGLYAINDRSYYVRIDPKTPVRLRQSNGRQEVLVPVVLKNGSGVVQYSIVF